MVRMIAALLLACLFAAAPAQAENYYAGVFYGQVESDEIDVETGNLGLTFGSVAESGLGFEVLLALTVEDDEIGSGVLTADASTSIAGFFAMYKTPGNYYAKIKGGFAHIDVEIDFDNFDTASDNNTDIAFGLTLGARFGNGALELSYLVLPELDEFEGANIDADFDMLSLGFNWHF